MSQNKPVLIIINQTVNEDFIKWISTLADEVGTVVLWTGSDVGDIGSKVIVCRGPRYDKSSAYSRLYTWTIFTLVVGLSLLMRQKKAPLFVVTNPPLMPLMAGLLHFVRGYTLSLLEWDIYPQIASVMSIFSEKHFAYRTWYWWHAQVLKRASTIVTISDSMADELQKMVSENTLPISVIPTWVDANWIKPLDRSENPFAKQQNLKDKLIIMYSGNMGATHAIETIVEVAEYLREVDNIAFILIGDGTKRELVRKAIEEGRTPNIRLLPWQPIEKLPYTLASADVGIVTLAHGYEKLSMPSKTYSLMAAGNALLGISTSPNGLSQVIEKHKCGANFGSDESKMVASWILSIANDRQNLQKFQDNARNAAEKYYSANTCSLRLTAELQQGLLR